MMYNRSGVGVVGFCQEVHCSLFNIILSQFSLFRPTFLFLLRLVFISFRQRSYLLFWTWTPAFSFGQFDPSCLFDYFVLSVGTADERIFQIQGKGFDGFLPSGTPFSADGNEVTCFFIFAVTQGCGLFNKFSHLWSKHDLHLVWGLSNFGLMTSF